jgi:hypothetical protein
MRLSYGSAIRFHVTETSARQTAREQIFVVKRFGNECRPSRVQRGGTNQRIVLSNEDDEAGRGRLRDATRF